MERIMVSSHIPRVFSKMILCPLIFFVLAIKGLGGILKEDSQNPRFCYNWWCQHNAITHMCFADDLMIYCRVDRDLVKYMRKVLDDFAGLCSLVINLEKSLSLLIRS